MITFAYYLLKVMTCSGIMFSYYLFALRNKRFHQYNRFYLLSTAVLSYIIPLMRIEFWKETVQQPIVNVITIVNNADAYVASNTPVTWNWNNTALAVFVFISFGFLLSILVSLLKIFSIIRTNPKQFFANVCFVFCNTPGTPFSFFKYIFWNEEIDVESEAGKRILKHELAHVHEYHSGDKLFLNLMLIVGWCNPFLWFIRKELNMIHEFIADQKAVSDGDASSLAMMLLETVHSKHSFMFTNSFFYSPIKRRLIMLSKLNPRYSYLRRLLVLPLLTMVTLFFAFKAKERYQFNNANQLKYSSTVQKDPSGAMLTEGLVMLEDAHKTFTLSQESLNRGWPPGLVILDGTKMTWKEFEDKKIAKMNIAHSVFFTPGAKELSSYGEEGKNGVAIFTTKTIDKEVGGHQKNLDEQAKQENREFALQPISDTIEPQFPGGAVAWRKYLEKNLDANVLAKNNAPAGMYTVKLAFNVSKDGTISNIIAETKPGYGAEEEAIKVIAKGPKWEPAKKDGSPIEVRVKQFISFLVSPTTIAQFPGGLQEWRRYLERNADLNALAEYHAPEGKYPVVVTFTVGKDGSISNIVTETKTGYGTEELVVNVIRKAPNWVPEKKDGAYIESQVTQTLIFTMVKERWAYVEINSITVGNVKTVYKTS